MLDKEMLEAFDLDENANETEIHTDFDETIGNVKISVDSEAGFFYNIFRGFAPREALHGGIYNEKISGI